MALSGINKRLLATFGGGVCCYISDPRVVRAARTGDYPLNGRRRIAIAEEGENKLFVSVCATDGPVPLLEHNVTVSGVVGVPVGFVAAGQEALTLSHFPAVCRVGA